MNKHIRELRDQVLRFLGNEDVKIIVFGSRARSNSISFSDVDIGIIPKGQFNRGKLALLMEFIENSNIPYKIDIVDFSATSEQFRKEALKDTMIWKE